MTNELRGEVPLEFSSFPAPLTHTHWASQDYHKIVEVETGSCVNGMTNYANYYPIAHCWIDVVIGPSFECQIRELMSGH